MNEKQSYFGGRPWKAWCEVEPAALSGDADAASLLLDLIDEKLIATPAATTRPVVATTGAPAS